MVSSCPSIKKPEQEKEGKARVFALTYDEAAQNLDVMQVFYPCLVFLFTS